MNCETSLVKIVLLSFIFNKEIRTEFIKNMIKSLFDINFYKETFGNKENIIIALSMVTPTIYCCIFNVGSVKFTVLLLSIAFIWFVYAVYILFKDVKPICNPLCNAVGKSNFKRTIELVLCSCLDYEPKQNKQDIEILENLRKEESRLKKIGGY